VVSCTHIFEHGNKSYNNDPIPFSEAPRASARGICGKAKRNCAEAAGLGFDGSPTRLRSSGYGAVAYRHRAAQALAPRVLPVLPHGASWRRRV